MDERVGQAVALYRQGNLSLAERLCQEILAAVPDAPRPWYLLGLIAHKRGNVQLAAEQMREAVRLAPQDPECLTHATELFRRAGLVSEAIQTAQKAVQVWSDHPAPQNNLGLALKDAERLEEAEACFRHAIALDPSYARAYLNLGNVLHQQDRSPEAQASFQQALRLRPHYPEALNSAGQLVKELGDPASAVRLLRRAIELRPGYPKALLNLANALSELGQRDEATTILCRLTEQHPEYGEAFHDLGALYERQKEIGQAIVAYEKFLELQPDSPSALAAVENAKRHVCDWSGWPQRMDQLLEANRAALAAGKPAPIRPLVSCRFPTTSAERQEIACSYARRVAARVGAITANPRQLAPHQAKQPSKRLRIGILSHEFCYHVVSHLMLGLYRRFDRSQFEVFAFDYSADDASEMRQRIIRDVEHFVVLSGKSAGDFAAHIAASDIHILLDINSYMPGGRPEIAAHRPAPIQVSHMYPATTGADYIDYFITDPVVTPPGDEAFFREQLVYLPCSYLPTDCDQAIDPDPPSRSACGLPTNGFVFCSFNKSDKIEPALFDVWMSILRRVPAAVLWLRDDGPLAGQNLRREAEQRGIDPRRLVFAPQVPGIPQHLARQQVADLFLDTLTHGAHGTAVDALWAGLPLLTRLGDTFTARVAASLLTAAGLPELIVETLEDYEELAVQLATSSERLDDLRQRLARNRRSCDLFNTDRYTRNLERAFVEMWNIHQSGEEPRPIHVETGNRARPL